MKGKRINITVGKPSIGLKHARRIAGNRKLYLYECGNGQYKLSDRAPKNKAFIVIKPTGNYNIVTKNKKKSLTKTKTPRITPHMGKLK